MRRRFVCIGCSGGCELITDSFECDDKPDLPGCSVGSCEWKELKAEEIPCPVCNGTDTFAVVANYCDTCKSITEITNRN